MAKEDVKKVTLSVQDRLSVGTLLPEKGTYLKLLIAKHINKKTELSSEEVEKLKVRATRNNGVTWDQANAKDKPVELTITEISFLNERIDEMDKAEQIPFGVIDLCEKIKGLNNE